jgi:archaellin
MKKDVMGFAGIGTLILVIAMILIAVVAVGVLMHSGQLVAQQAQHTGTIAGSKSATAFKILHAYGDRDPPNAGSAETSPGTWATVTRVNWLA